MKTCRVTSTQRLVFMNYISTRQSLTFFLLSLPSISLDLTCFFQLLTTVANFSSSYDDHTFCTLYFCQTRKFNCGFARHQFRNAFMQISVPINVTKSYSEQLQTLISEVTYTISKLNLYSSQSHSQPTCASAFYKFFFFLPFTSQDCELFQQKLAEFGVKYLLD